MDLAVAGHDAVGISDRTLQILKTFSINSGHGAASFINDGVRCTGIPNVSVVSGMNIEMGALLENQPDLETDAATLNRVRDPQRFTNFFNTGRLVGSADREGHVGSDSFFGNV